MPFPDLERKQPVDSYDDEHFEWLEPADTINELEKFHELEQKKYINEALGRLQGDDANVVTLFYLDDCSIEEIGEITGLGQSNVKVKLFRARKRLYEALQNILKSEIKEIIS